jgi:hypothetical protein
MAARFEMRRFWRPFSPIGAGAGLFLAVAAVGPGLAKSAVNCGGAALLGGAQLLCSHIDPQKPAQLCTYSWALATPANQTQVVSGSFLLAPGSANVQVYQGAGFSHAMSEPIVLCQGKRQSP